MIGWFIGRPIGGLEPLRTPITVTTGAYALTGQTVTFTDGFALSNGTYVLTGQVVPFKVGEAVATGAYVLTGQGATFTEGFALSSGAYAVTGKLALLGVALNCATGGYTITGNAVTFTQVINGAGGEKRKPKPQRTAEIRLHDRKITVTDPDGKQRKVSYAKRFKPPPPLAQVPDWVLPQVAPPPAIAAEPRRLLVQPPLPSMLRPRVDQDEEDILAILGAMQDPVIADAMVALAAIVATQQMGTR